MTLSLITQSFEDTTAPANTESLHCNLNFYSKLFFVACPLLYPLQAGQSVNHM